MSPAPADFGFSGRFLLEPEQKAPYASASGILAAMPAAAAIPNDAQDVAALMRWASESGATLVPRGAATGMPGGNVGPHVIVDMVTNFRAPPAVDRVAATALVQPGSTLAELNSAAAEFDLYLPVDPSSAARCTLGGMIANNAAGAHSLRYGATRPWVRSVDLVLADGTRSSLTRGAAPDARLLHLKSTLDAALAPSRTNIADRWPNVRKNSSGYALREYLDSGDLLDLVIGSEGTLGIVTGATLDLAVPPRFVGLLVLEFDSLDSATQTVLRLLPFTPDTCELLDRTFIDLVRRGGGSTGYPLHSGIEALLLVEFAADSPAALAAKIREVRRAVASLASRITEAVDPVSVARLWEVRHAASPIIAREAGTRVSMQFIEDSVVPLERLTDYIRGLRAILDHHRLPAVIFGHAGDGNIHVNPLVDVTDPEWRGTLHEVLHQTTQLVVQLGGTLAGEHGDGRLRAPLLQQVWGDQILTCFHIVKDAFDPQGLLNPGVILPLRGQRPFDLLRDPS
ncbi:MAG: FAD-binding oxidoreductase [Gemmatimonadota bacterium]